MATELATAYISLVPSLQGVQGNIAKELGGAGAAGASSLGGALVGGLAKFAAPLAAALGVGKAIATGFQEVKDAAAGTAQLAAGIKSTGGAAGVTVGELNDLASSIQAMSGQTDDSIVKAQGLLLTFTNIRNVGPDKIFDQATLAAANMAARMGTDASASAIQLGKALNDPTKGVAALSRMGVQFTAQQKEQIKVLQESGDTLGAQKIILAELETQFGGSAKAAGETLPGMIERAKRGFEDLTQSLVGGLVPVMLPVLDLLIRGMAAVGPVVEQVGQAVGSFLVDSFAKLGPILQQVGAVLGPLVGQLLSAWASFSPLSILLDAILPMLPQLVAVFAQLATTVGGALGQALTILSPVLAQLADTLTGVLAEALALLLPVILDVVKVLGPVLGVVISALVPIITTLAGIFGQLVSALAPLLPPIISLIPPIAELVGTLLPPLVELFSALLVPILKLVSPLIDLLAPALEIIVGVLSALITGVVTAITWFVQLVTGSEQAGDQLESVWSGVLGFFGGLWDSIIGFFRNGITTAIRFFTELPRRIVDTLSGLGRMLFDIGRNMIQGLLDGAGSLLRNIGKFFLSLVPSWIVEPFKAALGIRSPSKVFQGLGEQIGNGLVAGLDSSRHGVTSAATRLLGMPSVAGFGASFAGAAGAGAVPQLFVQNPFTGEYLLARVDDRADVRIANADAGNYATIRGGVWR